MISKVPMVSCALDAGEILGGIWRMFDARCREGFRRELSTHCAARHIYLFNSGISSFYIILLALKRLSPTKREVVLPAYTAGSLVVAVRKAGLTPLLCDISPDDYGITVEEAEKAISPRTLAVVGIHMFGLVMKDAQLLRARLPREVFVVEDCAQAMGSETAGRQVGNFGDVSFFSFNRGKNLPLFGGGAIATDNEAIRRAVEEAMRDVRGAGWASRLIMPAAITAFALASSRFIYGAAFSCIARFKETRPPKDFSVRGMGDLEAGWALLLMRRRAYLFGRRHENGIFLLDGLKGAAGIELPQIREGTRPVFNRLPVVFKEIAARDRAQEILWQSGIETSRMYGAPLYRMFAMAGKDEDFPSAAYAAERLLTLPVHPALTRSDLTTMIDILGNV